MPGWLTLDVVFRCNNLLARCRRARFVRRTSPQFLYKQRVYSTCMPLLLRNRESWDKKCTPQLMGLCSLVAHMPLALVLQEMGTVRCLVLRCCVNCDAASRVVAWMPLVMSSVLRRAQAQPSPRGASRVSGPVCGTMRFEQILPLVLQGLGCFCWTVNVEALDVFEVRRGFACVC